MKNRKLISILALIGVVLGVLWLVAGPRYRSPEKKAEWMKSKIARHLELNDEQKTKLDAVTDEILRVRSKIRHQGAALFDEVLAQIRGEHMDEDMLLQRFEEQQIALAEAAQRVLAQVADLHATLSPEQKNKILEGLERFHHRIR
ncbi:MAG TPA: periplasmic heavy metal sensor [Candidatus Methylomirabilis sp.]|nr:periplasmic heavy metal sensor [Candidatus Methylomirabilis sp.]